MRFAIEFISSPVKAIFIAKFGRAMRAVIALVLISSFATSFAQAPADTREARLALAAKEVKEALGLARTNETQSAKLAITKLQTAESIYMELGEKARLLGVLFFLGHLQLATQPPRVRPNPTPANAAPPRPQDTPEPPMDPELSIPVLRHFTGHSISPGNFTTQNNRSVFTEGWVSSITAAGTFRSKISAELETI